MSAHDGAGALVAEVYVDGTGPDPAFADAAPQVVCLPWFGATRQTAARAFQPALADSGLRTAHLDLPGHGDSPGNCPADSQSVLEVVCSWLEARATTPVLLAGASYGAYLAAGIARQRPELVRGLLLVSPGVRLAQEYRDLPEPPPAGGPMEWLGETTAAWHEHFWRSLGNRTPVVAAAVEQALGLGGAGDEEFRSALQGGPAYSLPDETDQNRFPGPVVVITGRQDGVVGYADQFRMMANYPAGTFAVLDEAGHYLPFEQPAALRALTQDWLRRARVGTGI